MSEAMPASPEAVSMGCICHCFNATQESAYDALGNCYPPGAYSINGDCPMHGATS